MFGFLSLHGFSAVSGRLQWTLPRGSQLLPAAAVVHVSRGAVFDGFINSISLSAGYALETDTAGTPELQMRISMFTRIDRDKE